MRTPEEIIGRDALLALEFAGYQVVAIDHIADAGKMLVVGPSDFDQFWAAYPRKVAKPAAEKAYRAARKRKAKHLDIMDGVARLIASRPDPQFIPHPATWLNGDRWNDRPLQQKPQSVSSLFGAMADYFEEQDAKPSSHPAPAGQAFLIGHDDRQR